MPRRPTVVTHGVHGGDFSFDEDLTRSDIYDQEIGVTPAAPGADPYAHPSPSIDGRDFMTPGTDLVNGPNGQVTTGQVPRQSGVPTPDSPVEEPMTDPEVLAVIEAELSNCSAQYSGELAENRIDAMEYYLGKMEQAPAGRSQAVSTDVADVVEWIKPQVIRALTQGDVVELVAENEEDEKSAQLEVEACEHVLMTENQGFLVVYQAVTDALLQKNGVAKVFQDERTSVTVEDYSGLTEENVQQLLAPGDGTEVELMAANGYPAGEGVVDPMGQPLQLYDVTVNRYRHDSGPTVDCIPPEEFLVNRDAQSIDLERARFTAHKRLTTESELIAEGWPEDMVRDLPTYSVDTTGEREERRSLEDEKDFGYDASDRAVRRIQVIECYGQIDRDRDGIAELLLVHVAGEGSYYLMGIEPVDSNPFVGTTAILLPHKFYGRSIYDRIKEIQDQKTEVVRGIQDNLRHQNNSRLAVVAGQVNLDDLLTSRPGGIVRQKQPGMIEPLVAPQLGDMAYKHLEYLNETRTGRAGVSPDTASMVEAIAGDTAHGLERLMSAKEELVGLMIELFAETLMRGLVCKVRALLQKHRTTPMHFKSRGKWQQVDPGQWSNRTGAVIQPGLGYGDRMKRMQTLQMVYQQQMADWQDPVLQGVTVTPQHLYRTRADFIKASNLRDASPYWQDPTSPEAMQVMQQRQMQQQQQQQMQQQMAQQQLQLGLQLEQEKELTKRLGNQADQLSDQSELLFKYQQLSEQMTQKYTELEAKYSVEVAGEGKPVTSTGEQPSA